MARAGASRGLLPGVVARAVRPAARHDRAEPDTATGFLRVRYRSAAPIHVGTGALALAAVAPAREPAGAGRGAGARRPVRETARIGGRPGVPGSTIRGALRERHGRLTRSCVGHGRSEAAFRGARPTHPALDPCRGRELCPSCALFGTLGLRSRLRIGDALAPEGVELLVLPLPSVRRARSGGGGRGRGAPPGRAGPPASANPADGEWAEAIPPETLLEVVLAVRNLRLEELGALLGALGCEPVTPLICGGGRRAGFGRLFAEGLEVELYQPDGALLEADVASWRKAFEQSTDRWLDGEEALLRDLGDDA